MLQKQELLDIKYYTSFYCVNSKRQYQNPLEKKYNETKISINPKKICTKTPIL